MLLGVVLALGLPAAAAAQQAPDRHAPEPPPYRISGLVFGDYYTFPAHHQEEWEGQHGLWIRRVYFTYDHTFSPEFTTRIRLEANSNGKLQGGSLDTYVKDAYLRWTFTGRQNLFVGLHPSLTMDFVEGVWGLRHVEKTPLDLYKVDSARETGFSVSGPLNADGTLSYGVQFGNDSGNHSETNKGKAVRAMARYDVPTGLSAEVVFLRAERPEHADRTMLQTFGTWRWNGGRLGAQYAWQSRKAAEGTIGPDVDLNVFSAFGVVEMLEKRGSAFLRVDRFADPCADCGTIDYLPIATTDPFTLTIAGFDYRLHPAVRVSPNIEWVKYSGAAAPESDVAARLTFFWTW